MKIGAATAFVTGAASGLGRATAESLARRGANVACFDRDRAGAQSVADRIGGLVAAGDVTDPKSVSAALDAVTNRFGAPRILVNCAGIGTAKRMLGREGPMPLEDFESVVRVNLKVRSTSRGSSRQR